MPILFKDLREILELDDLKNSCNLNSEKKIILITKIDKIMKNICQIFQKLSFTGYLKGGQILLALAKLSKEDEIINKNNIGDALLDRPDSLKNALNYLEKERSIIIKEKSQTFHIVKLNEKEFPAFKLLKELVQAFWNTPKEEYNKAKKGVEL